MLHPSYRVVSLCWRQPAGAEAQSRQQHRGSAVLSARQGRESFVGCRSALWVGEARKRGVSREVKRHYTQYTQLLMYA